MSLIFLASFSFVQLSLLLVQESTVYTEFFLFEKRFGLFFLKNNYTVSNKDINIGSIKSCSKCRVRRDLFELNSLHKDYFFPNAEKEL